MYHHPVDEFCVARTRYPHRRAACTNLQRPFRRRIVILDQAGASMLKELLTNEPALPLSIDASAREVITEIGNILLNACLGTFGNLLKVQVSFSVPQLSLESLAAILETLRVNQEGVKYALVVHAGFKLRDAEVRGFLVIVLSVASLDRLIRAVEDWEQRGH